MMTHHGVIYLGVIFTSMLLSLTSRVIILANNSHFFFHLLDILPHRYLQIKDMTVCVPGVLLMFATSNITTKGGTSSTWQSYQAG